MGMYDTVQLTVEIKCPRCGEPIEKPLQTKDLECLLDEYNTGDNIGTNKYRYLSTTASCTSTSCREWERINRPNFHGFGYVFNVEVYIDKEGNITDDYVINDYNKK